jgi:hypothetical protein
MSNQTIYKQGSDFAPTEVKVVIRGERTLYCAENATETEINAIFAESDELDRIEREWEAKGSPWTEDDEAFLNRMSA